MAEKKRIVEWVKEHMAEVVDDTWTPGQYLLELAAFRQEQAQMRRNAAQLLRELAAEGVSEQELETVRAALNEQLVEEGIMPLDPPRMRPRGNNASSTNSSGNR